MPNKMLVRVSRLTVMTTQLTEILLHHPHLSRHSIDIILRIPLLRLEGVIFQQ